VAKVAMSHGVNANIVHGWRKLAREREGAAISPPGPPTLPAKAVASAPQFLPVSMAQTAPAPAPADIRIELRRGAVAMKITWPIAAAGECAAWMRELLIESLR
jgi:transposase